MLHPPGKFEIYNNVNDNKIVVSAPADNFNFNSHLNIIVTILGDNI